MNELHENRRQWNNINSLLDYMLAKDNFLRLELFGHTFYKEIYNGIRTNKYKEKELIRLCCDFFNRL